MTVHSHFPWINTWIFISPGRVPGSWIPRMCGKHRFKVVRNCRLFLQSRKQCFAFRPAKTRVPAVSQTLRHHVVGVGSFILLKIVAILMSTEGIRLWLSFAFTLCSMIPSIFGCVYLPSTCLFW